YINNTSTKISSDGDAILNRVDDLQDVIEILRKDVAVRGVKPKTSNLEAIKKELENTQVTLTDFNQFIKDNKPELKSKWEAQLVSICDQQQMLSLQEDLIMDLQSDLEKCKETLDLVILCSEERSKN
ncbi:actin nucleation cofactor Bud6 core domain, partial [Hanseniaspora valbyensis NRRL Y-1626]